MSNIPDTLHQVADIFATMRNALISAERELRAIGRTPETLEAVQAALALAEGPPKRPVRNEATRVFTCERCGDPFTAKKSNARYCSDSCRTMASRDRRAI